MNFNFIERPQVSGRNNRRNVVTVDNFFENESNTGYIKAQTFTSMMEQIKTHAPGLYVNYNNFFICVRDGYNIRNTVQKQTHLKNQSDYYHLRFSRGKQFVPTTIYEVEGLGRFISDYANGLIETNFTLDDLLEACKQH